MNSAAFGVFAAVLIICALMASFGRSLRIAVAALGLFVIGCIAFFAAESSFALAVGTLVILVGAGEITRREVGKKRNHLVSVEPRRWWPIFAALPLACGAGLGIVVAAASGWHQGVSTASLITVFHYRYPIVGVVAVLAIAIAFAISRININLQSDEATHHQTKADKASQAERMARRRADREAARQRRREGRASG